MAQHHGISVRETTDLGTLIRSADTAVIGAVCTADDADAEVFPLNRPVLLTRVQRVLGKAGQRGTLYTTLKAISDQSSPRVVMVRVPEAKAGEKEKTQEQLVIGATDKSEQRTGMQAWRVAESTAGAGVKPSVLIAPLLDTPAAAAEMIVIARALGAFAYLGAGHCQSPAEVVRYRQTFSQREAMILWPEFTALNAVTGEQAVLPATAVAAGLRARIDTEQGWHKSLSNVPVSGVLGLSRPVDWSLEGTDTDAALLNRNQVTTLIHYQGFRFWGNRSCDSGPYVFEVYTRTAQILRAMIAAAHFAYIDKPLTPGLAGDIIDGIQAKGDELTTQGRLLGFDCWYDPEENPVSQLRDGEMWIKYAYTPVPPLEHLGQTQVFTDKYFARFEALA